jgi:hypothetical protein
MGTDFIALQRRVRPFHRRSPWAALFGDAERGAVGVLGVDAEIAQNAEHRLRRLEERTGRSLSDPRANAELSLAFEIDRRRIED